MPMSIPTYYLGAFASMSVLPVASSVAGYWARVTVNGVQIRVVSDGTYWRPDGPQVLARGAVAVSCTVDTAEDNLVASLYVPVLTPNASLRITYLASETSNANTKTLRVYLGSSIVFSAAPSTVASHRSQVEVRNRGLVNSQVSNAILAQGGWGASSATPITTSVDTSAATTLSITGQKQVAGDTLTLESYLVEWLT